MFDSDLSYDDNKQGILNNPVVKYMFVVDTHNVFFPVLVIF